MSDETEAWWTVNEVERAKREASDFAEVQARALAKARNEKYNPAVHGPHDVKKPPRQQRQAEAAKPTNIDAALEQIMGRFRERGPKYTPRFTDQPSRPDTHRKIAP